MYVTNCLACGSKDLVLVLDLGYHPLADFFVKGHQLHEAEIRYPLQVLMCRECKHAMNSYVVPKEVRYQQNDYSYDSNNSKIAVKHFTDMASEVSARAGVQKDDLVIDVGSNVGTLLSAFKNLGAIVRGIEPAGNIAAIAEKNGIPTINDFFSATAIAEVKKVGLPKVITITNAFNHVEYLEDFMKTLLTVMGDESTFVIEFPYFLHVLERRHFDVVYLEHVSYFSVTSMASFMKKFGLSITHVEENDYMSGSIRFFVGRGPEGAVAETFRAREVAAGLFNEKMWAEFAVLLGTLKLQLLKELVEAREQGGKIVAVGAAAKGNTLLNFCGIDRALVDFATDASPLKIGKYTPGSHLPILSDDAITPEVTHALILAWNIADFLKAKIAPRHPHLAFIAPHVVESAH